MKETGSKIKNKKQKLQERVVDLYGRGRDNLTMKERKYFKLPVKETSLLTKTTDHTTF